MFYQGTIVHSVVKVTTDATILISDTGARLKKMTREFPPHSQSVDRYRLRLVKENVKAGGFDTRVLADETTVMEKRLVPWVRDAA